MALGGRESPSASFYFLKKLKTLYNRFTPYKEGAVMAAENKAIVRRYIDEAWNGRKPSLLDQLVAANATSHDPNNPDVRPGPQGHKDLYKKYTAAFPDVRFTIDTILAEGELVTV